MKAVFCFSILLLIYCNPLFAYTTHIADTNKRSLHILDTIGKKQLVKEDYELSKTDFITRYGFDENANKIITFYFDKIEETKSEKRFILRLYLLLLIPISIIGTALFYIFLGFILSTMFMIVLLLNIIFFISNMLSIKQMQEIYSKSKLLKTLVLYRKTRQFPDAIRKYKKKDKTKTNDDIE